MDDLQAICIPPHEVSKIWPGIVHDLIDAGFAASDVPMPDDIVEQLRYGTRLLWVVIQPDATIIGAVLTQLFEMRSGMVCQIMECGGSRLEEWIHLRVQIEEYAKAEGCDRVMVTGRQGWSRVMKDYRVTGVILEKRI